MSNYMALSFHKQLQRIFGSLAYIATGFKLQPIVLADYNKLQYECKVADQIHTLYEKDGFHFSDEGTTVQSIAQEIQMHLPRSHHLHCNIDSFGSFIITPKPEFLHQLEHNSTLSFKHEELDIYSKVLEQSSHLSSIDTSNPITFFIENDITLSGKRRFYYLKSLVRKYLLLKESTNIVVYNLNEENILENSSPYLHESKNEPPLFLEGLRIFCERHNTLYYEAKYKNAIIYAFGGVFLKEKVSAKELQKLSICVPRSIPINKTHINVKAKGGVLELGDRLGADELYEAYCIVQQMKKQANYKHIVESVESILLLNIL